ncbi:hypothetical protein ACOMHN_029889 [Nucella lapillus]
MAERNIPPSANWYLSAASDANESGVYVYASKQHVCVFDISDPSLGPRLLRIYAEHTERVAGVALSPNIKGDIECQETELSPSRCGTEGGEAGEAKGRDIGQGVLCCSGGDDKFVKIWTVDTLMDVQSHCEHKEKITTVCWSPVDASLVASSDEKGEVILWNLKFNTLTKWRYEKNFITCMAFCPHQPALLAVGFRVGTVFLLNFSGGGGSLVHRLRGHEEEVLSVSWCPVPGETFLKESPDGTNTLTDPNRDTSGCLIASGSKDRTIRVWTLSQGKQAFLKKLPIPRREPGDQGPRLKVWLAIHWLKSNPEQLVSSSSGGDLLLWTLRHTKGQSFQTFGASEFRPHMRPIFNICAGGPLGKTLCTFAQDRQVVLWDVDSVEAVASLSTLGGHVYCVRNSPIDPGRVAIGSGDSMIRLWNTSNRSNPYDISSVWQGIKSKVTAVAWHPTREGWLGFGTEDGRVGVFDVLSHKLPMMSNTFHRHTVYVVCWGPPSENPADTKTFSLYSIGDCKILEHTHAVLSRGHSGTEALDITARIVDLNTDQLSGLKATELSWNSQLNTAAIGADDGSVYIVSLHNLKLLATIKVQKKLVNCTRWHPRATAQSPAGSPCKDWLATAGNDQTLHVLDLSRVVGEREGAEAEPHLIMSSVRELSGHLQRITDMCWSTHHDARMVTVGYDAEAFVWDVQKGTALAGFKGHWGRILTCQFSGLDPDLVITGGSDSKLLVWRVSEQPAPEFGERRKKRRKKTHASAAASVATAPQVTAEAGDDSNGKKATEAESTNQELQNLQEMLDRKRQDLLQKGGEDGGERVAGSGRTVVSYEEVDDDFADEKLTQVSAVADSKPPAKTPRTQGARHSDPQPPPPRSSTLGQASKSSSSPLSSSSPMTKASQADAVSGSSEENSEVDDDDESDDLEDGGGTSAGFRSWGRLWEGKDFPGRLGEEPLVLALEE